jgi:pimeloyl-ACP methyl ester carboxylesterase
MSASRPTVKELRAAGLARRKAAKEAKFAERSRNADAEALWTTTFTSVVNWTAPDASSTASGCHHLSFTDEASMSTALPCNQTVIVIVPGFSSASGLTKALAEEFDTSCIAGNARTVAFRWPAGHIRWTSANAAIEAAAAWQGAFENTVEAGVKLAGLLETLIAAGNRLVVIGHSLGCRVVLSALSDCKPALDIDVLLLAAAVDNDCFGDGGEFASVDAASMTIVHSRRDPSLCDMWAKAEYARCGRTAKPALGFAGPDAGEGNLDERRVRCQVIDVTESVKEHAPLAIILSDQVRIFLNDMLR